jgi:hypothetical protein
MERRLRRLEAAASDAFLRRMATVVAADLGLEPALVLAEAQAILARCAGLSPPEIAAREGFDLAELEAATARLMEETRA